MVRYTIRRILYLFVVLFVVSLVTFALMHAVPGGPFDQEKAIPRDIKANLNARYHLDDPFIEQFSDYLFAVIVPHLTTKPPSIDLNDDFLVTVKMGPVWLRWMNFGPSLTARGRTVNDILREQLPVSAQLGMMALLVSLGVGLPLGVVAALKHNTMVDYASMGVAILGVSVPVIVLGPLLVWIFGISLEWLPPAGWGARPPFLLGFLPTRLDWTYFRYAIMPSVTLGLGGSAVIARLTRASLLQSIREDYIRTARAKGLREGPIIARHALKNSMIPVVTIIGPMFAALVTGTFVTEIVFGIPGMGRYFVTSITNRDYPVIMGTIMLYAMILVVANLVVDLTYAFLDPRIHYQ